MVSDDTIVISFCIILMNAQGSSGKSVNFCDHFVEASRFDGAHIMSSAHLVVPKPLVLLLVVNWITFHIFIICSIL